MKNLSVVAVVIIMIIAVFFLGYENSRKQKIYFDQKKMIQSKFDDQPKPEKPIIKDLFKR